MTIAVVLKVGDGIVLGADSATTLSDGQSVSNVYFNAEKVFNLAKGFPIGALAFGLGALQGRSISNLAKDLRGRLAGTDPAWYLEPRKHTVRQAAERLRRFFYEELYQPEMEKRTPSLTAGQFPAMGFYIAGYSAAATIAEIYSITVDEDGKCGPPIERSDAALPGTMVWAGQPEALNRLVRGWSGSVVDGLVASGIPKADAVNFLNGLRVGSLASDGMPIQDAIDLVQYMIDVTAGFVRFAPGAPVVHPPIDIAAITLYEGYRWVRRKHYFTPELNPGYRPDARTFFSPDPPSSDA